MSKQITVEQHHNPKYIEPTHRGTGAQEHHKVKYIYWVKTAKNVLNPVVDEWLLPSDLELLIESGVDVNIRGPKK